VEIFARSIFEQGFMAERDFRTYYDLFYEMIPHIKAPDVIIYLKASMETLFNRIKNRGRNYEKTIDPNYLKYLNSSYEKWMKEMEEKFNVVTIDADKTDYLNCEEDLNEVITLIKKYCP
jgi:deoxyadenosine/deoxycytidine kinase